MRLVVFGPNRSLGAIVGGKILDLSLARKIYAESAPIVGPNRFPLDLRAVVEGGEASLRLIQQAVSSLASEGTGQSQGSVAQGLLHGYGEVRLHAPIPTPYVKIVCAGANFASHTSRVRKTSLEEATRSGRERPFGFMKVGRLFVGDGGRVEVPGRSKELDYEIELAAIIGRRGRDIPREKAVDYVFGYTVLLDYSLRDQDDTGPFSLPFAKNFDGCGALGPTVVTKDEIQDPHNVRIELRVNGELRQQGSTREMIQRFDEMIEWYSRDFTLFPGDILSGGTCSGTALEKRNLEQDWSWFLKPGDLVEGWVEGVGRIRNQIVAKGEGEAFD